MKKTKDITKYNIDWQIIRVCAKKMKTCEEKIAVCEQYFKENMTVDNKERYINWLEGLLLGYKASNDMQSVDIIIEKIDESYSIKCKSKETNQVSSESSILKYDDKRLSTVFNDLCDRNIRWLSKGYFNTELNEFIDNIHKCIRDKHAVKKKKEKLDMMRCSSKKIKNTYSFIY